VSVSSDELAYRLGKWSEHRSVVEGYQSARFCAAPQCELTSASCRGRERRDGWNIGRLVPVLVGRAEMSRVM